MMLPDYTGARTSFRSTLTSCIVLAAFAALAYGFLWLADFGLSNTWVSPLVLAANPDNTQTLVGFGEVTVAVLGIAITVVSIIVELAANRYSPRITELFIRDPVNGLVMGYFVVTVVLVVWVDMSLFGPVYPKFMVYGVLFAITTSLLMLLPYFAYVFEFLSPTRVVESIKSQLTRKLNQLVGSRIDLVKEQVNVCSMCNQLGDIALKSVENKDKAIAIAALQALGEVARGHLDIKNELGDAWFDAEPLISQDPDFMSFQRGTVHTLIPRRTWLEMKLLLQYRATFNEALHRMRDVAHLVAIYTRQLGVRAAEMGDVAVLELTIKFTNSFLRAAINARDLRTVYHIQNEIRCLAETLVQTSHDDHVIGLAHRMKYYGQVGFQCDLSFILETAAYDLSLLLEMAHEVDAPCQDELLDVFLDVDRQPDGGRVQEASLRGVRKAQVKLATVYMERGDVKRSRRIFEDMVDEDRGRLQGIRIELESVRLREYWEVSDRGLNFDWLPESRRRLLAEFFGWFEDLPLRDGAPPEADTP